MNSHSVGMSRDSATKRVMLAVAVGPSRVELPFTAADGSKPLVITTPNENVSDVIERIEAVGGSANIALAYAQNFTIFTITRDSGKARPTADAEVYNKELSMGMFYLRARNKRGGKFRVNDSEAIIPAGNREFAYAS